MTKECNFAVSFLIVCADDVSFFTGSYMGRSAHSEPGEAPTFLVMRFDDLTHAIYLKLKHPIEQLTHGNREFTERAFMELDNFLIRIDKKAGKIFNYVNSTGQTKPLIYTGQTTNFIFQYTINPDKTSVVDVSMLTRISREFDPSFLTSRIRPNRGYVYFLHSEYGYKIGCTKDLNSRINAFGVKLPFKTELHSSIETKNYGNLESFLHNLLAHKRLNGEWFSLSNDDFAEIDLVLLNKKLIRIPA